MSTEADRQRIEAAIQQCYSTWGTSYHTDYYGPNAPYPPIHLDILKGLIKDAGAKTLLDAGCGPASILRHLTDTGAQLYGFDLTTEMVVEANRVMHELKIDPARVWQGSVLEPSAFSCAADGRSQYDAVISIGVLPHIPAGQDNVVFGNMAKALRTGGLAVVEARNQLFSLFTLNRPSYEFVLDELVRKDELLARAGTDRDAVAQALDDIKAQFRMDMPPVRRGKAGEPGYDEVLSRTHNPLTLRGDFERAGFHNVRLLFYHFHVLPPILASRAPEFFLRESVDMEKADDWRGYFMASAFLLCGTKT